MSLKVLNGARVLVATDGTNALYIDTGREIIPITGVTVNGGDGGDGGYYTPNVNTVTGYVTWTPSKPGMPAIQPSVIKGPAGRGVFGIDFSVNTAGELTGGTVYYDDGSTSRITFTVSNE